MTPRQREIVRALVDGGTNREIAVRLGLKEQTVKNRLTEIYEKCGVRSRLELAIYVGKQTIRGQWHG